MVTRKFWGFLTSRRRLMVGAIALAISRQRADVPGV